MKFKLKCMKCKDTWKADHGKVQLTANEKAELKQLKYLRMICEDCDPGNESYSLIEK